MDDFEDLLASESDDEHIKEVKRDNIIFTNFGISLNQEKEKEKEKKKPSDNIFKGLLSDENEESDPHLKQKQKKKEEKKHNSLTIKHKKKKNKIPFNLINKKNNIINNIFTSGIESKKKHKGKKSITGIENNEYNDMNLKSISIKNKKKNHPKKFNEDHYEMHLNNIENINDNNLKKSNSINKDLIIIDASKKINKNSDCDISEHYYYLNLKPNIDKILSSKLTDTKEVNEQNTKINFLLEQLNIIQKSLKKKKCNKEFLFTQEHFLKIDKITNDYKEQYENLKDRMNIFSVKKYEPEEKENILDEINYYEKKIEYYKTLNKVNENIISSNEKNPEIKEMIIKYVETNYDNLKLENEKLTKIIKRNKCQIPKNEKIIEDLNKQLLELQNNAKVNYNIDDNFNKEIYGIVNKDLIEEKEKIKKKLEIILNFAELERKKYEDFISIKEQEIKMKTNEINKFSNLLNKESSRSEMTEKELNDNLTPLLNLQKQIKRKKEIERKKQMEENIIKKIKQKLEEKEKKEKQKRNKLVLIQSLSLEKMKKKLIENNNKNSFNTISNSERQRKVYKINNITNNSKSNISNFFLTEGNQSMGNDSKSRNINLKNQNLKINSSQNSYSSKTEFLSAKQKGKIANKAIRLIYDKDKLNNNTNTHNKTLTNNNYTKYKKIYLDIKKKDDDFKSEKNIHKLTNENKTINEEKNKIEKNNEEQNNKNDNQEINHRKSLKKNSEKDNQNIKEQKKNNLNQEENKERNINEKNPIRDINNNYIQNIRDNHINQNNSQSSKENNKNNPEKNIIDRSNSFQKNPVLKEEKEEKDTKLSSEKMKLIMLSSDIFKKINENNNSYQNYNTPKFKEFEEDEYNLHHHIIPHKSYFSKNTDKQFIDEDSDLENGNIRQKMINSDDNNEEIDSEKVNISKKNSVQSNNNNQESSNFKSISNKKSYSPNHNSEDIKINFNKHENYAKRNLKSKISFNKISKKIFNHNSSSSLHKDKNLKTKESLDDNISDIANINQNNTNNSYEDSFFSSDDNEIEVDVIPKNND